LARAAATAAASIAAWIAAAERSRRRKLDVEALGADVGQRLAAQVRR
jgi:hypothetical protein